MHIFRWLTHLQAKNFKLIICDWFQPATLGNLCKDNACVVIFFRRWGCVFCRMWAKEVRPTCFVCMYVHAYSLITINNPYWFVSGVRNIENIDTEQRQINWNWCGGYWRWRIQRGKILRWRYVYFPFYFIVRIHRNHPILHFIIILDLYLSDKDAYKNLGFKRFSYISVAMSMLWTQTRNAISKSKTMSNWLST